MKNYIKEGFKEKILIRHDDGDLIDSGQKFINKLDKLNLEFVNVIEQKEKDFSKILNLKNTNFKYIPEALTRKSPLTIIDAKWGSGKTYFIEKLMENLSYKRLTKHNFTSAILVDAWKMSLSNDPLTELMSEIVSAMLDIYPKNKVESFKDFASWTFFTGKKIWKNRIGLGDEDVDRLKYEEALKKLSEKQNGYTLIFVDNLERVGREAWDILKAISKFLIVKGFVFVLPINLDKMHKAYDEVESNIKNESAIEKYLDIKYFEFEQEYAGLLRNLGIDQVDAEYYSKALSESVDGNLLSIREIKKRIEGSGIFKIKDSDERIIKFQKNIWKTDLTFKEELQNRIKKSALNYKKINQTKNIILNKIKFNSKSNFSNNNLIPNDINIINEMKEHNNKIVSLKRNKLETFDGLHKLSKEYYKIVCKCKNSFKTFDMEVNNLNAPLLENKNKREALNLENKKLKTKIIRLRKTSKLLDNSLYVLENDTNSNKKEIKKVRDEYVKVMSEIDFCKGIINNNDALIRSLPNDVEPKEYFPLYEFLLLEDELKHQSETESEIKKFIYDYNKFTQSYLYKVVIESKGSWDIGDTVTSLCDEVVKYTDKL